jgi:hypothetical protein
MAQLVSMAKLMPIREIGSLCDHLFRATPAPSDLLIEFIQLKSDHPLRTTLNSE